MQQALPAKVEHKLRAYPFTRQPTQRVRSGPPAPLDKDTHCRILQTKLRCDIPIIDQDVRFLAAHPDAATWLRNHVEPQLWAKMQPLLGQGMNAPNDDAPPSKG